MVKDTIKRHLSVENLSNNIESKLWYESKSLNPKADRWDKPVFDVSGCKDCEYRIRASLPYESQRKEDRCLNVECWEKKNSAAVHFGYLASDSMLAYFFPTDFANLPGVYPC